MENHPPRADDNVTPQRRLSQASASETSQTAADFIRQQLQMETDAREALPYSSDMCTQPLGPLRQNVYACLTCKPPPNGSQEAYEPAGICYACHVECHGSHELVEIFQKRDFVCDCGTTRFGIHQSCTLRPPHHSAGSNDHGNQDGGGQGKGKGVHSEPAASGNRYNQNFHNRFCGCTIDYKPEEQQGVMFQCLGLGSVETGGCGEDWYHPGCLMGLGPKWFEAMEPWKTKQKVQVSGQLPSIAEDTSIGVRTCAGTGDLANFSMAPQDHVMDGPAVQDDREEHDQEDEDPPLPNGFPGEDDFDHLICYRCIEAHPWIKRYAGTPGFLAPVYYKPRVYQQPDVKQETINPGQKRKAGDNDHDILSNLSKRTKSEPPKSSSSSDLHNLSIATADTNTTASITRPICKLASLPLAPSGQFSLFVTADFRTRFCRCLSCFPQLSLQPQLLHEEDVYEPPLLSDTQSDGGSANSLLERGESALKNVDRVRAIEGVMAYNHLKDRLKPFFQQFADSGRAISADDIKSYFEKLRGDEDAMREAKDMVGADSNGDGDERREQKGY